MIFLPDPFLYTPLLHFHHGRVTKSLNRIWHSSSEEETWSVVYLNQLLGACSTEMLVELLYQPFLFFFLNFKTYSVISRLKSTKKSEKEQK